MEAVGGTSRGTRGGGVRNDATCEDGDSCLMTGDERCCGYKNTNTKTTTNRELNELKRVHETHRGK